MHEKIIVTGQGTGVGKTIVSAIIASLLEAEYWKPIECGEEEGFDSEKMAQLIGRQCIHPSAYSFHASLSPHHAARLENMSIQTNLIKFPLHQRHLIVETAGGIFVPINVGELSLDFFESLQGKWIIVSRHYLGSINHTLLTIEALKMRGVPILGIIFNGEPVPDSEEAILNFSQLPLLGRLLPEKIINQKTIQKYAARWKTHFLQIFQSSLN